MDLYQDACELLDADHIAVKHLFVAYAQLAFAPDQSAAQQRGSIAARICEELTVHAQIEEEIFYPALREALPDAAPLLDEAREEHQQAKDLIARIRALATADATMDTLVQQLNRAIEHHVKEERDELFPKARAAAGLDLAVLADQLKQRQEELTASAAA